MKIPISKPFFGEEEKQAILNPLETGWVVQGPHVAEFERLFAEYTGSRYAVATTSCTTALHLALIAIGVGPGDEVIVPAFTWVATANVVEMQGARPVFVDIDRETFNLDVTQLEKLLSPRTKAIIPVSLFGLSAPMAEVNEFAKRHNLQVIEDDACALGAHYQKHHAGTLADIACFSFHPRKAITTGEGGMVITDSEPVYLKLQSLRDHGASKSDLARHQGAKSYFLPEFEMVGYNYRMTDIQGALGVVQMKRLDWILKKRLERAEVYHERLSGLPWLQLPAIPKGYHHGYQAFVCLFGGKNATLEMVTELHHKRNELMDSLEKAGIATRPGTHAVTLLSYYAKKYEIQPKDYPNAYLADQLTITLPLYAQMTVEEQEYVIRQLQELKA